MHPIIHRYLLLAWLVFASCLVDSPPLFGANLTGRWSFNETAPPYADTSGNSNAMAQDPTTATAQTTSGVDGNATQLVYQALPGIATRLCTYGTAVQTNSFGFAFWVNPINLNAGDNLLGKEMMATSSGDAFSRLSWQVHLSSDNGSGFAPLEFLVRGSNRANGNYFGNVISSQTLPLHTSVTHWFHVAGGYNATTGKLAIFVDAVETDSTNGIADASNSDGGAVVLGTMLNNSSFVSYAGVANYDDLQLFDGPLAVQDAMFLLSNPGMTLGSTYAAASPTVTSALAAHWTLDESTAPYADSSGNGNVLGRDPNTAAPLQVAGVTAMGARLTWETAPGAATRLCVYNGTVQNDSFGFSFWLHPFSMDAGDNLIGKEMPATTTGDSYTRLAWQVHLGADNGSGYAPVEFLVRGNDRTQGNFYGNVLSSVFLPLQTANCNWYHIAGGYDTTTGKLSLFINGVETDATNGVPGAHGSDGSAFTIGTMVNGSYFVAFGTLADFDDVQLYKGTLASADVAELMAVPGRAIPVPQNIGTFYPRDLVAHWKLDESAAPYAEASGKNLPLNLGNGTTPALCVPGLDGNAAEMIWQSSPGVTTRLCAYDASLQTNSFGFSFWVQPVSINASDNLIGKEINATTVGDDYTKLAWQVHMGADNGTGAAPVELVLRGANRSSGNFFGSVLSTTTIPLHTATVGQWYQIAGGYDSGTGKLSLFVNGVETDSINSQPGAWNSDGGAFVVGTMVNGTDNVAYSAQAIIDDVQVYDGLVSALDVSYLKSYPGAVTNSQSLAVTGFSGSPAGVLTLSFTSYPNYEYTIEATRNLASAQYIPIATVTATADTTTVALSKATVDAALHDTRRPQLYFRVLTQLPAGETYNYTTGSSDYSALGDPFDSPSQGYPVAAMTPFLDSEPYVPQFHFSLASPGYAAGDPSGMIRYQNQYDLFTWNHAVSPDMVTWTMEGWPFNDLPSSIGIWNGAVAVDLANTSGLGTTGVPPMVAVYTGKNVSTLIEDVRISSSTDYKNFTYYPNNPVVPNSDTLFRDPDVLWDPQTSRWVMTISHAALHHLEFWTSPDLKNWTLVSWFGPFAAQQQIWEVPGLIQMPVRGMPGKKKWVLFTGMGPNTVQYFVGEFDGTTFTLDADSYAYLAQGTGLDGTVFADFEGNNWSDTGWTTTGAAFGSTTGWGKTSSEPATGYLGQRLASSYINGGDWQTGTLTSPTFTITSSCINFLIGGGNHPGQTCMNLLVNGQVVQTATGENSDTLKWQGWNVSRWKGQTAQLQIVDNYTGFWGRIYVDQIMFSNTLMNFDREHANWVDYGSDFYAARVFHDYDGVDQDVHWMGWLGNWDYNTEEPVPTNWGKGTESLPRVTELVYTPKGYQIVQRPLPALQKLRGNPVAVTGRNISGTTNLTEFQPTANTYEIDAVFNLTASNQNFGLNLCVGGTQKVVIGYDASSSSLYLDRTASGDVAFDTTGIFPSVVTAPLTVTEGYVKLHIFVDQTSIEVFANDGKQVITSTIYPDPTLRGVQLFSNNGTSVLRTLDAWQLATIWK